MGQVKVQRQTIIKLFSIIASKRRFLLCPKCEKEGRINVLGEFMDNGDFEILRFHNNKTIIRSGEFEVICGLCKECIYCKVEHNG